MTRKSPARKEALRQQVAVLAAEEEARKKAAADAVVRQKAQEDVARRIETLQQEIKAQPVCQQRLYGWAK